ncbi:MAG: polyphosphate polymerase domain-containing protein [Bacilli bacterium]|nr:polyphosphate polymerase domain-containing protein [Bacilli bacterium]
MNNIEIFKRIEQKYLLSENEYNKLMNRLKDHIVKDKYFQSTICNVYFDTDNYDLIVSSIEKDIFKEKVRLRSYNIPNLNDIVFLEIKSKLDGVVYKRRVTLTLDEFYNYLNGKKVSTSNNQIMNEIDYVVKKMHLAPKYFIAYDRTSYYDKNNKDFRITFDENIRSRQKNLNLENGDFGKLYFKSKKYIMELKNNGGLPLWFTHILSDLKIYPTSFSKYANIYKENIKEDLLYV